MISASELSSAIRKYVKAWEMSPEQINNGNCGFFAAMVIESLGGETDDLFESFNAEMFLQAHVWITFQDRHYDAECPDGVDEPSKLPFFLRQNCGVVSPHRK